MRARGGSQNPKFSPIRSDTSKFAVKYQKFNYFRLFFYYSKKVVFLELSEKSRKKLEKSRKKRYDSEPVGNTSCAEWSLWGNTSTPLSFSIYLPEKWKKRRFSKCHKVHNRLAGNWVNKLDQEFNDPPEICIALNEVCGAKSVRLLFDLWRAIFLGSKRKLGKECIRKKRFCSNYL